MKYPTWAFPLRSCGPSSGKTQRSCCPDSKHSASLALEGQMKTFTCVVVLGCMVSTVIWAQSTAQIHGTVQDPSGAAVPAAEVKAIQVETGVTRSVASQADGGFVLTNLPLGSYRLEIGKEGFATFVNTGIV